MNRLGFIPRSKCFIIKSIHDMIRIVQDEMSVIYLGELDNARNTGFANQTRQIEE